MFGIKIRRNNVKADVIKTMFRSFPEDYSLDFRITDDVRSQFLNAYLRNPYVRSGVDLIANSASNVRAILKSKRGKELSAYHPLRLLFERPNPNQTYTEFMHFIHSCYQMNGNAYIYKERGVFNDELLYLWSLSPNDVRIVPKTVPDLFDPIDYYEVGANRQKIYPKDMIHIKTFNPLDPTRGVSPLLSMSSAIEQQILIDIRNSAILKNEGKPRLKYKIPEGSALTDHEFEELKLELRSIWGTNKAGAYFILDNGNDVEEMFVKAVDVDFYVGSKLSMRQICVALHLPPEMLGDGENKTYANAMEARKQFAQDSVLPLVRLVFDALYKNLKEEYSDVGTITFDEEDINALKGDELEILKAVNSCNFISQNEKRERLGYEMWKGEGGDDILVVGGTTTLKYVSQGLTSSPGGNMSAPDEEDKKEDKEEEDTDNNDGSNQKDGTD